jgi:hypothetical protein
MLINSGVILLKYWFSVSSQEQVHSRPAYGRHVVQASSNLPGSSEPLLMASHGAEKNGRIGSGCEMSSRRRVARAADFRQDGSPCRGLHARRESWGAVPQSKTISCRPVPNPNRPFRHLLHRSTALAGGKVPLSTGDFRPSRHYEGLDTHGRWEHGIVGTGAAV